MDFVLLSLSSLHKVQIFELATKGSLNGQLAGWLRGSSQ